MTFRLTTACLALLLAAPAAFGQGLSAPGLSFGNQAVSETSSTRAISFRNTLLVPVTLLSVTLSGGQAADFALTFGCVLPAVVAPGRTCAVGVRFTPGALGVRTSTLVFAHDQSGSPLTAPVTGTGVPPVSLGPSPLSFGNAVLGASSLVRTAVVTNAQIAPLSIASISVAAPFSRQGGTCPAGAGMLAGRTSCSIFLVFSPTVAGVTNGSLTVAHGGTNSPLSATLSGNGVPPIASSPASLAFPSRTVGTTSPPAKVGLLNRSAGVLTLGAITASGDFSVSSSTCGASLAAGAQCALGVVFAPTATGARNGVLSIVHGAFGSPLQIPLAGTGNVTGLLSIAVTPAHPSVRIGDTQPMTATGTFLDGHVAALTTSVAWTIKGSSPGVAGISNAAGTQGVVSAWNLGTADVTATLGAIAGFTGLTVITPTPASLVVTPSSATIGLGQTQQFTATATYSDGSTADVTNKAIWNGGFPRRGSVTTSGLYTAMASGANPISASVGARTGPASAIGAGLTTSRAWGSTSTVLLDGRVLIAGGLVNQAITSVELFDPGSGTFAAITPMNVAREGHTATRLADGRVLVVGGFGATAGALKSAEIFDPANDTWTLTGTPVITRGGHTATLIGTKVLVAGGVNGNPLPYAELYDPATGRWTPTGSLAAPRGLHDAVLLADGRVIVVGGATSFDGIATAEIYNPAGGFWTPAASMSTARKLPTATLLTNGDVLVVGGSTGTAALATAELFHPATGTWSPTMGLTVPTVLHTATRLPSGEVLIAGGAGTGNESNLVFVYNPSGTANQSAPTLAYHRYSHTAVVLNDGRLLFVGGYFWGSMAELRDPSAP